jgi:hypothetical protein
VTYPFSTPSCLLSASEAVEETAKSRAFPRRVGARAAGQKIKSSTAITGLLKSMTEAARFNPRRTIVRRAPKRTYLTVMVLVEVFPPALETTVTRCGCAIPVKVMV